MISDTIPNRVILRPDQALANILEIKSYDALQQVVKIQESQIQDLRRTSIRQDSIISWQERTIFNLKSIDQNNTAVRIKDESTIKDLEKKNRRLTIGNRTWKVLIIPIITGAAYAGSKLF